MSEQSIITLLTDFGLQDVYVGVMKGVIAQINPSIQTIDITHHIPPQDLAAGRFCLMSAYAYFPAGTVYLAVVDPGVGTQRRGVAIQFSGGYLVGPDNGLLSGVLSLSPPLAAVELTNPNYWRTPNASSTFHGRDIFAPVGAYLASGVPLQMLGNLITNIPAQAVEGKNWSVIVKSLGIAQGKTYSDVEVGKLLSLIGSHGWLEIAVNGGSAQSDLELKVGDQVQILL